MRKPILLIKVSLFISSILFFSCVMGQGNGNMKLPNVVPASPEMTALAGIGSLSAGLHSGSANVNIPLFEIKNGALRVPISLSYSTNGIRVNDIASRVGLGWNIIAGATISRVIHDEDDLDP